MRTLITFLTLALVLPLTGCGKQGKDNFKEFAEGFSAGVSGGIGGVNESKEFREFSPPGGEYTILMPGRVEPPSRARGGLKITGYGAERAPGEGYVVVAGDIPPGFTLDGVISEFGGDGYSTWRAPGQERPDELWITFQVEKKSRPFTSGRAMVVGRRFYLLFAEGPNARLSNPDVRTFIDSFRLNGRPTPGPQQYGALLQAPADGNSVPVPLNEGVIGDLKDPPFRDEAPSGGMLVGFDVWYDKANADIICAVRPIYRTGDRESVGQLHGKDTKRGVRLLAKPGYAVGQIDVKWGAGIYYMIVTYMKANGQRLDPNDSYTSEKAGVQGEAPWGGSVTKFGGEGKPIRGIIGRKNESLTAFGLTLPPKK